MKSLDYVYYHRTLLDFCLGYVSGGIVFYLKIVLSEIFVFIHKIECDHLLLFHFDRDKKKAKMAKARPEICVVYREVAMWGVDGSILDLMFQKQ